MKLQVGRSYKDTCDRVVKIIHKLEVGEKPFIGVSADNLVSYTYKEDGGFTESECILDLVEEVAVPLFGLFCETDCDGDIVLYNIGANTRYYVQVFDGEQWEDTHPVEVDKPAE